MNEKYFTERLLRIERELAEAKALVERAYLEGLEDGPMWHDHAIAPSVLWPASEVRKALEEL